MKTAPLDGTFTFHKEDGTINFFYMLYSRIQVRRFLNGYLGLSFRFIIEQGINKREAVNKEIRDYLGVFPNMGGGLPNSQNFCKLTKYFFVCQIHSEVLKHVLQMGG